MDKLGVLISKSQEYGFDLMQIYKRILLGWFIILIFYTIMGLNS